MCALQILIFPGRVKTIKHCEKVGNSSQIALKQQNGGTYCGKLMASNKNWMPLMHTQSLGVCTMGIQFLFDASKKTRSNIVKKWAIAVELL